MFSILKHFFNHQILFFPDRKKVSELTLPSHPLPQKILIESEVWTQSEWFKIEIMNKWIFNHLSKAWWATSLGKCFLNISEMHLCSYLIIQTLRINYELHSGALGEHHWCTWQGKKKNHCRASAEHSQSTARMPFIQIKWDNTHIIST